MNIYRLTVLGMALLGAAISPPAADQPALSGNLKPLAKGLGQWTYNHTDDKGQVLQGNFTSQVAVGGSIIINKNQTFKDGKVVFSAMAFSYWQPETKSIGCSYFDSMGVRGYSFLINPGDNQVWQGCGYDVQGKFGTAVSTIEYQGDDTYVSQMIHIVSGGKILPDSQKWTLKRVKDLPLSTTDQPGLNENLKPLARILSKFNVDWTDGKAQYTAQTEAGGSVIVGTFEVVKNGKMTYPFVELFYWRPESQTIRYEIFFSTGRHDTGTVIVNGDQWIIQEQGHDEKGKPQTLVVQMDWPDHDTLQFKETHFFVGGEFRPDSKIWTHKRIKE